MSGVKQAPTDVVLVGAGNRSSVYAEYARTCPDLMRVVAVADPMPSRRQGAAARFNIPPQAQFHTYEELLRGPRLGEAAINGTMDELHHASTLALLDKGYHVLLEKPIARTEAEVRDLIAASQRAQRLVMVGHVLRCAPFFVAIKEIIASGRLGRILAVRTTESVDYGHVATSFIRGKWNQNWRNPIMMSKCCHDLDLLAWYKQGKPARRVASFGGRSFFRAEQAPAGAAERCVNGCPLERTCPYSARRLYVEKGLYKWYVWKSIEDAGDLSTEAKLRSLATDNPYGRCVWRCDNDVMDQQTVLVEFADGTQAAHCLFTNVGRSMRDVYIVGTAGDLRGDAGEGTLYLTRPDLGDNRNEFVQERIDTGGRGSDPGSGHGGGDLRLIADFVAALRQGASKGGATRIEDSLAGHLIGFAAERSLLEGRPVDLA